MDMGAFNLYWCFISNVLQRFIHEQVYELSQSFYEFVQEHLPSQVLYKLYHL